MSLTIKYITPIVRDVQSAMWDGTNDAEIIEFLEAKGFGARMARLRMEVSQDGKLWEEPLEASVDEPIFFVIDGDQLQWFDQYELERCFTW